MIVVEDLEIQAGSFRLAGIGFEAATGAYAVLMGKTGSGKTTLLEGICGLKPITAGRILLNDRDVTRLKPAERGIGFVPQDIALFRTMTVFDHLAFALVIRKWDRRAVRRRVDELADLLGIAKLLERKPHGLSGGESQRVALGRALAAEPGVLCLDEPLSALDDATRHEMYQLLEQVRERTGVTTLHITHNLGETRRLANRLFVLENGILRERPVNDSAVAPR